MKKYRVSNKRKDSYHLTYTIHDYYHMSDKTLDKAKWLSIVVDFFTLYIDFIVKERKVIPLPGKNGIIRPCKRKTITHKNHLKSNYAFVRKETDKNNYYFNLHSAGFYFKWIWDKTNIITKNKIFYKFEPSVFIKKELSKEIIKCSKDPYLKDFDALS